MDIVEFAAFAQNGDWTEAFKKAAQALKQSGGGVINVPPGEYQTRSIQLYDHTTLHVSSGALIRFFPEAEGYPLVDIPFEGIPGQSYMPLIYCKDAKNVTVTGHGTLDGQGFRWWQLKREGTLLHPRPYFICFDGCEHVTLENVTLLNSPCWTVHPLDSSDVVIRGVTIRNPSDSPNTDGIDPDSCRNVRISDCLIDVGDDCIAIKSGTEDSVAPKPCQNILISHCLMLNGHGGVVIGSEMSGGVHNVLVSGCIFRGTDRGIRLKTRRHRGGTVSNVFFSDILMEDVKTPFVFNMYYFCGKGGKEASVRDKRPRPVDEHTPVLSDVTIRNITARNASCCAGFVYGLPESPVTRVAVTDLNVTLRRGEASQAAMMDDLEDFEARGLFMRNVEEVVLQNVHVFGQDGPIADVDASVSGTIAENLI